MPLPQWVARVNRRFTNPKALQRGNWPVLVHTGRSSGKVYRTPVGPEPIEGGYLFFMNYGPETDWVLNTLASGSALLEIDESSVQLTNPRVIDADEACQYLADESVRPPSWVGLEQCLVVDAEEPTTS